MRIQMQTPLLLIAVYFLILQSFFVVRWQSVNCFSLDQNAKRFSILWGYHVQMRSKVEGLLYFSGKKKKRTRILNTRKHVA